MASPGSATATRAGRSTLSPIRYPGCSTSIAVGMSIDFDIKLYPFELFGGGGDDEAVEE